LDLLASGFLPLDRRCGARRGDVRRGLLRPRELGSLLRCGRLPGHRRRRARHLRWRSGSGDRRRGPRRGCRGGGSRRGCRGGRCSWCRRRRCAWRSGGSRPLLFLRCSAANWRSQHGEGHYGRCEADAKTKHCLLSSRSDFEAHMSPRSKLAATVFCSTGLSARSMLDLRSGCSSTVHR